MRARDRWEVGSAFSELSSANLAVVNADLTPVRYYGSGRQALMALITHGRHALGWTALHLPAYYCAEVVESVAALIPVRRYDDGPDGPGNPTPVGPTEAVVIVSYFGAVPSVPTATPAAVLIDATHDPQAPWLARIPGDYVFASLRKTLPIPDGGAVWSGRGRPLPPRRPLTPEHLATARRIRSAMRRKAIYLSGSPGPKEHYLALFASGEAELRRPAISGISSYSARMLRRLPAQEFRRRRIDNAQVLSAELDTLPDVRIHLHPLGVVLEFDLPARRELVRRGLIGRAVYPAVLWPIPPGVGSPRHAGFAERMLLLHTDFRYDRTDMSRVAQLVRELCGQSVIARRAIC